MKRQTPQRPAPTTLRTGLPARHHAVTPTTQSRPPARLPRRQARHDSHDFTFARNQRAEETWEARAQKRAFYRAIVPDNTVMIHYCFVRSCSDACGRRRRRRPLLSSLTTISSFSLSHRYKRRFPDVHVKRFTDCGRYLVCFSRNLCDVLVYRYRGISKGYRECETKEQKEDTYKEINKHYSNFESYFKLVSTASLSAMAQANDESFCKDFLLTARGGKYLVVASSTQVDLSANTTTTTTTTNAGGGNNNEYE